MQVRYQTALRPDFRRIAPKGSSDGANHTRRENGWKPAQGAGFRRDERAHSEAVGGRAWMPAQDFRPELDA